jgi:hypothetical protein
MPLARKTLWGDFLRACGAILLGISSGLVIGLLSSRWDFYGVLVTLIVAPAFFIALLGNRTRLRDRTGVRYLGALAGWTAFVLLFALTEFNQWLLLFYNTALILLVTAVVAVLFIGSGLLVVDRFSARLWEVQTGPRPPL